MKKIQETFFFEIWWFFQKQMGILHWKTPFHFHFPNFGKISLKEKMLILFGQSCHNNVSIEEDCFFHIEISETMAPLVVQLVPLESSQWVHYQGHYLLCKSYQILNNFIIENSITSKAKNLGELRCSFGIVAKSSMQMIW